MEHISKILPNVLKQKGLQAEAKASLILFKAKEWIAQEMPHLKEMLHPTRVKDGELFIVADHGIALQECQMQKDALLGFLKNALMDAPAVLRLSIRK